MDFPKGVVGIIGDNGAGVDLFLQQAGGATCFDYSLDTMDGIARFQQEVEIERLRRGGATVVVASHNPDLLLRLADEVWWIENRQLALRGHPSAVLERYSQHLAEKIKMATPGNQMLAPSLRRGDGRAEIISLVTLDADNKPTGSWQSGQMASIEVGIRFAKPVQDPVVGIMIRTRIGFEVYGTNTELEKVAVGPCAAGEVKKVVFTFSCDLCPQHYTITAASHDPNGVWHDWMEDAIAITVTDNRYTAGVANLRASVTCFPTEKSEPNH